MESEKDSDEGVYVMLSAVREEVQESFGFSPVTWFSCTQYLVHRSQSRRRKFEFHFRRRRACEIASVDLESSQKRLKGLFDRQAKVKCFS